ncbi:MAG: tRNA (N6-isopentenyl adenosine(37)-C2)-methylthiotransferase MiaB [Clostridia bacterium]|nr:tRNA (N6-isopentenyl adenosine(37)-C2)-methylthiotransferase MiaB [Clostridia bacterium]
MYYKINTYGCQMNVHESEKLAGMLEEMGYVSTVNDEEADVFVFNTCCIRDNAEDRLSGNLGAIKKICMADRTKIVAVVGCMTQQKGVAEKLRKSYPYVDIVLGTSNLVELKQAIEVAKRRKKYVSIKPATMDASLELPIARTSYPNAWVNIMYGCNNFCTYCIVPYVRGRERSRDMASIVADCEKLIKEGYKEITLLGQNVDSYGSDLEGVTFADLLERIASIEGKFRIRFMTSHPKDINQRTVDVIAKYKNICNNVHLPVQSGSTKVLEEMNRKYTREDYLKIINALREAMPDVGITTDIMVGFPTETEEDYLETLSLVKEVRFSNAFTFVYSPRNGTPAAKMEQIDDEIKKRRVVELIALQNSITKEISDEYEGKVKEILVEDVNPKYEGTVCGRTECGRLVTFAGSPDMIGRFVNVKITRSQSASLFGEVEE